MKGPGADERYWAALAAGRLEMQQCTQCGRWNWPAVWRCGVCGCWEHAWHEVPLEGTVFAWTRTWHDFEAPRSFTLPFVSVTVALHGAGERRLLGTLAGETSQVRIGARVVGEIGKIDYNGEELPALRWRLVEGNHREANARASAT